MNKENLINEIVYEMQTYLTYEQVEKLKVIYYVKMKNCEINEVNFLPCVTVQDNEWIIKRFAMDMYAAGKAESTIKQYVRCVKRFLEYMNKDYREVTGQDIIDWLVIKQYKKEISQNGKVTLKNYLSVFFKWAYKKKYITENVMDTVDTISAVQKKKDRITDEEIEKMRDCCNTKIEKALFELLISCGLRVGELKYINRKSFNFAKKTVEVYGEKTKTTRICNLTVRAVIALKDYLKTIPRDDKPIFRDEKGVLGRDGLEIIAKQVGERAKVHIKTTVHVYRKTFASILYKKTKDIVMVSKLLGHSTVSVTVKYYLCDDMDDYNYRFGIAMN